MTRGDPSPELLSLIREILQTIPDVPLNLGDHGSTWEEVERSFADLTDPYSSDK
jgi:hypothetical protein